MTLVRQAGSALVYVVANGHLIHIVPKQLLGYAKAMGLTETEVRDLIVDLPADAPVWALPRSDQA